MFLMKKLFKKITFYTMLMLISTVSFANKGTMDEAQARSQMLKTLAEYKGAKYVFGGDSKSGIDCSHFANRGVNGVKGLNGALGTGYVSTAGLRPSKITKNLTSSQLKPGDFILMGVNPNGKHAVGHVMVYYGPGSKPGTVKVMDSRGGHGFQGVREIKFPPSRYAGAISVTDIIRANGYTPVNSDGSVILPPEGGIMSEDGNCVTSGGSTQAIASSCAMKTADIIKVANSRLSDADAQKMAAAFEKYSAQTGIPVSVGLAVAMRESAFNIKSHNSSSASGIMQVTRSAMEDVAEYGSFVTGEKKSKSSAMAYTNANMGRLLTDMDYSVAMGYAEMKNWMTRYAKYGANYQKFGGGVGTMLLNYNGGFKSYNKGESRHYVVDIEKKLNAIANGCKNGSLSEADKKAITGSASKAEVNANFEKSVQNINKMQVSGGGEMQCQDMNMERMSFLDVVIDWDTYMDMVRTGLEQGILGFLESLVPIMGLLGSLMVSYIWLKGMIRRTPYKEILYETLRYFLVMAGTYFLLTQWIKWGFYGMQEVFMNNLPQKVFADMGLTLVENPDQGFFLNRFWKDMMQIPEYYLKIMYTINTTDFQAWLDIGGGGIFNQLWGAARVVGQVIDKGVSKSISDAFNNFAKMLILAYCIVFSFWICILYMINVFVAVVNFLVMSGFTAIFLIANLIPVARENWGMNPLLTLVSAGIKLLFVFLFIATMMSLVIKVKATGQPPSFDEVTLKDLIVNVVVLWLNCKITLLGLSGALNKL